MRRRALIAALVAVPALAVAGCGGGGSSSTSAGASSASGGSSSARAEIVGTVTAYLGAIAGHDAAKACSELTPEAQRHVVTAASTGSGSSCEAVIGRASKLLDSSESRLLRDAKVVDVQVDGDTATASVQDGSSAARLTDSGGHWRISGGVKSP